MTKTKNILMARVGFACLAAGLLVACENGEPVDPVSRHIDNTLKSASWRQLPSRVEPTAEVIEIEHTVAFPDGGAGLSPEARAGIAQFVGQIRTGHTDRIVLRSAEGFQQGTPAAARMDAVAAELELFGFEADIGRSPTAGLAGSTVLIEAVQTVALAPDCSQPQPRRAHRPSYEHGCTTAVTRARMVARPGDIASGRNIGPGDGEGLSLGIQRYRQGEVTPVSDDITTTGE